MINDPLAAAIAEYTWVDVYSNDPTTGREHTDDGSGQWDFCVEDSTKLAAFIRQLRDIETSSLYTDISS